MDINAQINSGMPLISIVIPTRSRPVQLRNCLEAISRQEYESQRFEIVVVDDGSTIDLSSTVSQFAKKLNITLIKQVNRGPASARNKGAACAGGNIIAFTDDDCIPDSAWLKSIAASMASDSSCLVGGRIENALKSNCFSEASQVLIDFLYQYYSQIHAEMSFYASCNMACTSENFGALKGFSEEFKSAAAEDREFCNRWLMAGYRMKYAADAIVFHAHELNLASFWRQHLDYGRGAHRFHTIRARSGQGRVSIEPLNFYMGLIASPYSRSIEQPLTLSSLLLLSQIANVSGWLTEFTNQTLSTWQVPGAPALHAIPSSSSQEEHLSADQPVDDCLIRHSS